MHRLSRRPRATPTEPLSRGGGILGIANTFSLAF